MAAVLEALAAYVKKMITDMAEQEVQMLLGVPGEMEKLERNLDNVKAFLADAERRHITDQLVQGWVRMLKSIMYDAIDVLELSHLKAEERQKSMGGTLEGKMPGCFQPFLFCLRNPVFTHKIGSRIKELNQRLDDIHKEAAKFNFTANLSSYMERIEIEYPSQKVTSAFIPWAIVGEKIERDTKLLVQELVTDENHGLKVISIVGMGGMGKTTLAQKIFKESTIDEHFKTKIWLSITQQFDEVELLRTAIKHARGDHGREENNTLLTQALINTLSASKFLLVLDDMWSVRAWESVLSVPITNASDKQPGSRVLITTRFENLAPQMHDSFHQHEVSPLDGDDAWSLLKNQLHQPPNQVIRDDLLKDIGMNIIKKCGGLPLAIKIMGGLLRTKHQTELEWEAVLNHRAWSLDGLPGDLDHRLYLSYDDLSPQLKQCFLYCSLFPKGTYIVQNIVVPMWISEGFVHPRDESRSPEEVGTEYYQELIMRNLIEPVYAVTISKCKMHDVVRSFAEFMAREESLVVHGEQVAGNGSIGLIRRLSVGSTNSVPEWAFLQKQKSLRTLIINCRIKFTPGDSLTNFSSLRVLSIESADCDRLVDSLCQLRHLRFLRLCETNISKLPDDIHRLKLLQHLVLKNCRNLEKLTSSIVELVHLRTFSIYGSHVNDVQIPKGFGRLTNLRSLHGFPVQMDTDGGWCSLDELAPLSQLRRLSVFRIANVLATLFAEKAAISSKAQLRYLKLACNSCSGSIVSGYEIENQQQAVKEVFEKLCPPTCIEDLLIMGYFGRRLPNWMMVPATVAFRSLRYILLKGLPYCTQLPDGLCQLPSLEFLEIVDATDVKSVGPEFQASYPLAARGGLTAMSAAFPNMTNLLLEGLCEWEDWEWEEPGEEVTAHAMAMPALNDLIIKNCKLRYLPPGLASSKRHALRELKLYELMNLTYVENFPSVVELSVSDCPELKRIGGLSRLHKIRITRCPNLELLEGVPTLDSLVLEDSTMETLPGYLQCVNPRHLELNCCRKLYGSLSSGGTEWDKISHIKTHAIYCLEDSDKDDDVVGEH